MGFYLASDDGSTTIKAEMGRILSKPCSPYIASEVAGLAEDEARVDELQVLADEIGFDARINRA